MDIELLNKKAEEQANYSTHLSWGDRKECFISGADWLMQQPISERLTEEEMQALCSYFNWEYWDRSFVSDPVLMTRYNRGRLAGIFGADLFNNIPNRQRYDK